MKVNEMIKKGVVAGVLATTIVGAGVGGAITYSKLNKDEFKNINLIVTLDNKKVAVKETRIKTEQIKEKAKLYV